MAHAFPLTATVSEIQRNYRKLFNKVKRSGQPLFVLHRSKPEVAIVDIDYLHELAAKAEKYEEREVLEAIAEGEKEYAEGKTKELRSLKDLF